ncbi:hypothetical protein [Aureivirga sp. CE67]|uniref:hypothetical protein n=1 Tax=Aureivirga sp. CE67 TaxID=1788983 RepID=UPI0018C984F6|nr:hypothetical protein [Aureivirga sp. CE67]
MKKRIIDYKNLNSEILELLLTKYPEGYTNKDIVSFTNVKNELIEALEVRTEDTIFLVKVESKLEEAMEDFVVDIAEENLMTDIFIGI